MENVILGLSLLFAVMYVFFLMVDILRTAFSKLKGTDYKWSTSGIFQECQSWFNVLLLGVLLFLGLYSMGSEYARIKVNEATGEMTYCEDCKRQVPSKYILDFYGDYVCPSCFQDLHEEDIEWYKNALNMESDNAMIVETVSCDWCSWAAPESLYDKDGNHICINCIRRALQEDSVARSVWNFYEKEIE